MILHYPLATQAGVNSPKMTGPRLETPKAGGRPAGDTDADPLDPENLGILKRFRDGPG